MAAHSSKYFHGLIMPFLGWGYLLLFDRLLDDNETNKYLDNNNGGAIASLNKVTDNRTSLVTTVKTIIHSSKDLNTLAFPHLKIFLEKVSLLQLHFDRLLDDNVDNDSNNSCVKTSKVTNNRTIGLVTVDNDYHTNNRPELCSTPSHHLLLKQQQ